jgi:hypothetical protein
VRQLKLAGTSQHLEPGQTVVPHGADRDLTLDEVKPLVTQG